MTRRLAVPLAALAILLPAVAIGQTKPDSPAGKAEKTQEDQPPVIQLTLKPAGVPVPALKYQLLPKYLERTPGNGAPCYYRAAVWRLLQGSESRQRLDANLRGWLDVPLEQFPKEEVREALGKHRPDLVLSCWLPFDLGAEKIILADPGVRWYLAVVQTGPGFAGPEGFLGDPAWSAERIGAADRWSISRADFLDGVDSGAHVRRGAAFLLTRNE